MWFGWPLALVLLPIPFGFVSWRLGAPALNTARVTFTICLLMVFVIQPLLFLPRPEPGRRFTCINNLSQIGKALLLYEADHGTFPPLYTTDDHRQPLVSWRALILPYLEGRDIYEACHFDEPWDSPANAMVSRVDLRFFRCPSDPNSRPAETSYLAVVGPGTVWSADAPVGLDDIENTSQTILLVEVYNSGISWMEPRDLSLQDAQRGINATPGPSISSGHPGRAVILFADGHVMAVDETMTLSELKDLLNCERRELSTDTLEHK